MDRQESEITRVIEDTLNRKGYVLGSRHEGPKRIVTVESLETRQVTVVTIEEYKK